MNKKVYRSQTSNLLLINYTETATEVHEVEGEKKEVEVERAIEVLMSLGVEKELPEDNSTVQDLLVKKLIVEVEAEDSAEVGDSKDEAKAAKKPKNKKAAPQEEPKEAPGTND